MKKYVLIKINQIFYDGHGTPDEGGLMLEVEYTDEYNDMDFSKTYIDGYEVYEEGDEENWSAEDAYNCEINFHTYKEITKEEFLKYDKIINDYLELSNVIK